jgi:hypothetical protein
MPERASPLVRCLSNTNTIIQMPQNIPTLDALQGSKVPKEHIDPRDFALALAIFTCRRRTSGDFRWSTTRLTCWTPDGNINSRCRHGPLIQIRSLRCSIGELQMQVYEKASHRIFHKCFLSLFPLLFLPLHIRTSSKCSPTQSTRSFLDILYFLFTYDKMSKCEVEKLAPQHKSAFFSFIKVFALPSPHHHESHPPKPSPHSLSQHSKATSPP